MTTNALNDICIMCRSEPIGDSHAHVEVRLCDPEDDTTIEGIICEYCSVKVLAFLLSNTNTDQARTGMAAIKAILEQVAGDD